MAKNKKQPMKAPDDLQEHPLVIVPPPDSCKICRFWEHLKDQQGRCRRKPFIIQGAVTDFGPLGIFPVTKSTDWCGEFQSVDKTLPLPLK